MRSRRRYILSTVALGFLLCAVSSAQTNAPAFKVVTGNDTILALDRPRSDGAVLTFHRYPDGRLTSVRMPAITIIQAVRSSPSVTETFPMNASEKVFVTARKPGLQPGEALVLGDTAASSLAARMAAPARTPRAGGVEYVPRPGEGLPGRALFNPNRAYRPEWDSTLVPGYSLPFSNSRGDYVEGKTMPYPPGSGLQQSPGNPPAVIFDGTEPPEVLSRRGGWAPPPAGSSINPPTTADHGSEVPHGPDVHDVPRTGYDPTLPPPGQNPVPPEN